MEDGDEEWRDHSAIQILETCGVSAAMSSGRMEGLAK